MRCNVMEVEILIYREMISDAKAIKKYMLTKNTFCSVEETDKNSQEVLKFYRINQR